MDKYAIVLAGGKGTRMNSLDPNKSKVCIEILNKALVNYVIDAMKPLDLNKIITVVGHGGEETTKLVQNDSEVVWQREQKGTGHAVMQAAPLLANKEGYTLICCGDTPLLTSNTLQKLLDTHISQQNDLTLLTAKVDNPTGYGRIIRSKTYKVEKIIEEADCNEAEKKIQEVNAGVYVFDNHLLFKYLNHLSSNNKQNEYYLTDLLKIFVKEKFQVGAIILDDAKEMQGVNTPMQLKKAEQFLQERISKK